MQSYWLLLGILGVWRVTHLLNAEDGPWDVLVRLRGRIRSPFWGQLLDCFYCLSLWVALPFSMLGHGIKERLCLWLAFSGGAILLERLTSRESHPLPAQDFEEAGGTEHALLRQQTATTPGSTVRPHA
jgi:hypothetical protein